MNAETTSAGSGGWIDAYLRVKGFERSGRFYERLGVRRFYRFIVGLGGAVALPGSWEPQAVPASILNRVRFETRYYELANLVRLLCLVGPGVGLWHMGMPPVFWLVAFLVVFHFECMVTERYKRALCALHTSDEGAEVAAQESPVTFPERHWWFTPKRFETVRFYKALGFEWVRARVRWVVQYLHTGRGSEGIRYLDEPTKAEVVKFESGTRVGEMLHVAAGVINLPPAAVLWSGGQTGWAAFLVVITVVDFLLALLQRYHRVRAGVVLTRWMRAQQR